MMMKEYEMMSPSPIDASEVLALWIHKQFDDIEASIKLLSIAFDICKLTNAGSFVHESSILLFIKTMQNVNFIEEFEVDRMIIDSMSVSINDKAKSDDHQCLVQGCIEILDHIENLTFLLFDIIEIVIGFKLTGVEINFVVNEVMQTTYGQYVIMHILPAYNFVWKPQHDLMTKAYLQKNQNSNEDNKHSTIIEHNNTNTNVWSLLEVITVENQTAGTISTGVSNMYSYIEDIFDKGIFPSMSTLKYGMQLAVYENDPTKALKIVSISRQKNKYDTFLWSSAAQLLQKKGFIREEETLRNEMSSRP